jgi:hypothetical protein
MSDQVLEDIMEKVITTTAVKIQTQHITLDFLSYDLDLVMSLN